MAQSYKKGRKFKTESPALLSITRGGRPAAAPRPLPSAFRLCAPATIPASVPPSASALRAPPAHLSVPSSVAALCAVARTPLCAVARTPLCAVARTPLCAAVCIRSPHLRLHPHLCVAVGIRSPCPSRTPFRAVIGSCSLCRRPYTSLCLCQHPRLCAAVGIRSPHLRPHPRFCAAVCLPPLDSRWRTLSAPRKAGEGCPR